MEHAIQRKSGLLCNDRGRASDGLKRTMAFGVPHDRLQLLFIFGRREITAFFLKLLEETVVDRFVDKKIAVAGTA